MKRTALFFTLFLVVASAYAQNLLSIGTDVSLLRNFTPQQKFWAVGQGLQTQYWFTPKNSLSAIISYYTPGKFTNRFIAIAADPSQVPAEKSVEIQGNWRYRHVSLGWKYYLTGSNTEETRISVYSVAGFGLLLAKVENQLAAGQELHGYLLPETPKTGVERFNRLTFDLSLGMDIPVGADIFLFSEAKTWLPASDYPSPYFHRNGRIPAAVMISLGLRVLLGNYHY